MTAERTSPITVHLSAAGLQSLHAVSEHLAREKGGVYDPSAAIDHLLILARMMGYSEIPPEEQTPPKTRNLPKPKDVEALRNTYELLLTEGSALEGAEVTEDFRAIFRNAKQLAADWNGRASIADKSHVLVGDLGAHMDAVISLLRDIQWIFENTQAKGAPMPDKDTNGFRDALAELQESLTAYDNHTLSLNLFEEPGRERVSMEEEGEAVIVYFRRHPWIRLERVDTPSLGWKASTISEMGGSASAQHEDQDEAIRAVLTENREKAISGLWSAAVDVLGAARE